jgi:hypothetical protein
MNTQFFAIEWDNGLTVARRPVLGYERAFLPSLDPDHPEAHPRPPEGVSEPLPGEAEPTEDEQDETSDDNRD